MVSFDTDVFVYATISVHCTSDLVCAGWSAILRQHRQRLRD